MASVQDEKQRSVPNVRSLRMAAQVTLAKAIALRMRAEQLEKETREYVDSLEK